jgi:nitrous oxidase accessory protein NosD
MAFGMSPAVVKRAEAPAKDQIGSFRNWGSALRPVLAAVLVVVMVASAFGAANASPATARSYRPSIGPLGVVYIWSNGTISNPSAPISVSGTTYTLTGELNGSLVIFDSGITLNGAGYIVNYTVGEIGGDGAAVSVNGTTEDTVEGFLVANATTGIMANLTSELTVRGNNVSNTTIGIYLLNATGAMVLDNQGWSDSSVGVLVDTSSSVTVQGNHLNRSEDGVEVTYSELVNVSWNYANYSVYGVYLLGSYGATVDQNDLENVTNYPVLLESSSNISVLGNQGNCSTDGFYSDYGHDVLFEGNNASFSADGFGSYYSQDIQILRNQAYETKDGTWSEYSTQVVMSNNSEPLNNVPIYDYEDVDLVANDNFAAPVNLYGIYSYYSTNVSFTGNDLSGYDEYGVYDYYSSNLTAVDNNFSGMDYGVYIYYGYGPTTLIDNNISHTNYGVYAYYDYGGLTVNGNDISNTVYYGVYAYAVYGNVQVNGNDLSYSEYGVDAEDVYGSFEEDRNVANDDGYGGSLDSVYGDTTFNGNVMNHTTYPLDTYETYEPLTANDNVLNDSVYAMYLYYPYGVTANGNVINNASKYAMYLYYDYGASTTNDNRFYDDDCGVYLYESYGLSTANGNVANDTGYPVYLEDSYGAVTANDNFLDNAVYGIYVSGVDSGQSFINDNTIENAEYGIYDYNTMNGTEMDNNNIQNSTGYGIYTQDDYGPVLILSNDIRYAESYALYSYEDYGQQTIAGNDMRDAGGYAAYITEGEFGVNFEDNNASGSDYALFYDDNTYYVNSISGNDFSNSVETYIGESYLFPGIWDNNMLNDTVIDFDSNYIGEIYHNDLNSSAFEQTSNSLDAGTWNNVYPIGGNYWTNYTGVDYENGPSQNLPGSDGIGDSPYVLAGAEDLYPLMHAWFSPEVSFVESGLALGTTWTATLGLSSSSASGSTISFQEPNGAWNNESYSIAPVPGYRASPAAGMVWEQDTNVVVPIAFSPVLYPVTFTESGLKSGTSWSVTIGASTLTSTGSTIVFNEPNGTWAYTIGAMPGYTTTWTGSVTVSSTAATVLVNFVPKTYTVTFTESGLPAGTSWSLYLNGAPSTSITTTISYNLANGTYGYVPGSVAGYVTPAGGSVTVLGSAVAQSVVYTLPAPVYTVAVTETGLPSGTTWYATLGSTTLSSTDPVMLFHEANGTYALAANATGYNVQGPTSVQVSGTDKVVSMAFAASASSTFSVTFTETGLPDGTVWYVSLGSDIMTSDTSSIVFTVMNGTYAYTVGSSAAYTPTPASGQADVSGAELSVAISFAATPSTAAYYAVAVTETGLPFGASWSATVGGTTLTGTGTTLLFELKNGTYDISVSATGYQVTAPATVVVSGSAQVVAATFVPTTYVVTFSETGLPAGATWFVSFGATVYTCTGTTLTFSVANGTYSYTISTSNGYVPKVASGSETVNGAAASVTVTFTSAGGTTTNGASDSEVYGLIAGLAVLAALAVVGWIMFMRKGSKPTGAVSGGSTATDTASGKGSGPDGAQPKSPS